MKFFLATDNVPFKNGVYGNGMLENGAVYYAHTQFANEAICQGVGEPVIDFTPQVQIFEPTHLRKEVAGKRILLFFAGGLGDAVTVGTVLPLVSKTYDLRFDICCDAKKWSDLFVPMGISGHHVPYPVRAETMLHYDALLTDISCFYGSGDGLRNSPVCALSEGFEIDLSAADSTYRIPAETIARCKLPASGATRVGINFDSNGSVKSYPTELRLAVLEGLLAFGAEVYVFGKKSCDVFRKKDGINDLIGKTTIPELAAFIAQMDLFCGVDSFSVHLSNLLKKKTVVLLSTTTSESFAWHKHISCVQSRLACAPCFAVFDTCPREFGRCRAFFHESIAPKQIVKTLMHHMTRHVFPRYRKTIIPEGEMRP
jgi:hypothetical protein